MAPRAWRIRGGDALLVAPGSGRILLCESCPCTTPPTVCCEVPTGCTSVCDSSLTAITVHLPDLCLSASPATCTSGCLLTYSAADVVCDLITDGCPTGYTAWRYQAGDIRVTVSYNNLGVGQPCYYHMDIQKTGSFVHVAYLYHEGDSPLGYYCHLASQCDSNLYCNGSLIYIEVS